jgi:hypothetical protein
MRVGYNERVALPTNRVDDKLKRQMDLLMETQGEQKQGGSALMRDARQRANGKYLRLP